MIGWYRLPSGTLYHGNKPPRGVPCDPPAEGGPLEPPPQDARKDVLIAFVDAHNLDGDGRSATPNRTKAELWQLIEQAVEASQSSPEIPADVLVDQSDPDPLEISTGDSGSDEPVDISVGHEGGA